MPIVFDEETRAWKVSDLTEAEKKDLIEIGIEMVLTGIARASIKSVSVTEEDEESTESSEPKKKDIIH